MADKLREYLIALGFNVDEKSYKKFKKAVATTSKEVAGLGSIAVSTATAIAVSVEHIAREYEGLFYLSQRTKENVNNLKAYSFGMKQIGIDTAQSTAAIESFTAAQRLNPGIKGFVGLAGGSGATPIEQLTNFVEHQKKLYGEAGYYVAAMNAELAGIPEATFLQIWNNLPKLKAAQAEADRLRKAAGLHTDELTEKSVKFANSWDHLMGVLDLGKDRIALDLMEPTRKSIELVDELAQAFNRADVSSKGWLGSITGIGIALGGATASIAVIARLLGYRGLVSGAAGLLGRGAMGLATGTAGAVLGVPAAVYYGLGLNGATAGKEDDEPLSKEYRAKHGDDKAAAIAYFENQGWSRAAATGIAANLFSESGLKPNAVGDNGAAFGLAQWHQDRQEAFRKWSGKDIRSATMQEQLGFVQYELTQGADAQARRAGEKLRGETDPYNAGVIVSGLYERPADTYGEAHKRGNLAQRMYDTALTPAGGDTNVTINAKTDIHLPSTDPATAGASVASAQNRVNGDLVRNFQGAVR